MKPLLLLLLLTGAALAQTPSPFKKPLTLPGSSGAFDDVRAGWHFKRGRWQAAGLTQLDQSDTKDNCSNAWKSIAQNGKTEYRLKEMFFKGESACTTIYIMSDDGAKLERGNAYLIADYFDHKGKAEVSITKCVDDKFKDSKTFPVQGISGQWIDLRITYDPATGELAVERNGKPVGSWTDPAPIKTGKDFSLGTCMTKASFKDITVRPLP